ncbi:MAG: LptA/OstA family protein [Pseudomonadota bacterium]
MTKSTKLPLSNIVPRWALGGFVGAAVMMGAIQAGAQGIASHDSRAPVEFDAGRIELQDRENRVALSGRVIVRQAGLTVRSDRMLVNYTDSGSLDIQRITATGGVTVSRGNESASGDVAIYDFGRRIITMSGNVRLQRGADRLSGGRLVIDLRTGLSSVDGRASGAPAGATEGDDGRVTGSFTVPQGD